MSELCRCGDEVRCDMRKRLAELEAELQLSREQETFLTKRNIEVRIMLINASNALRPKAVER